MYGGANGIVQRGDTIYMTQQLYARVVSFNVNDVVDGKIDPNDVTVIADSYEGNPLFAPNDLDVRGNTLIFSDTYLGMLWYEDNFDFSQVVPRAMARQSSPGVYEVDLDTGDVKRIIEAPWSGPLNGVGIVNENTIVVGFTDFENPHHKAFERDYDGNWNEISHMECLDR
eukprot:UN33866